jgi:N-acetylneuraminic acid mutarotase
MKRQALVAALLLTFLLLLMAAMPFVSGAENSWATKASMHISRTGAGAAAVNGIVYVMGGSQRYNVTDTEFSYRAINATEAYNPTTDAWSQKASMPTSRDGFGVAVYQNKIYCIGGRSFSGTSGTATNVNEVYDTKTDSWQTKTPMPTARYSIEANVVDGKFYLIGGYESSSILHASDKVEVYNPVTDTWTTDSSMPTAVEGYASAVVDGKIYVISGSIGESAMTNLTQIYDPETDEWGFGAPIPMSVTAAAAGATTGTEAPKAIYVIGGANATYPLDGQITNQVYFPETNSWSMAASMPIDRAGSVVAVVNDTLYVMGGGHNIFTMDSTVVMQYTPIGYGTVPEFPSWMIPPILIIGTLIALVYFKKRKH